MQFQEDAQNTRLGNMSLTQQDSFKIWLPTKNGQLPAYSKWKSGLGGIPELNRSGGLQFCYKAVLRI